MANQQLVEYIKGELSKGINKNDIKDALVRVGWPLVDIEEAMLVSAGLDSASVLPVPSPEPLTNSNTRLGDSNAVSENYSLPPVEGNGSDWFKNIKPAPKRERAVIIVAISMFLIIAGGIFGYTYYSQIPGIVLKKMASKMEATKTMAFSGEVITDFETNSAIVKIDGSVDATDEKNPNFEMKVDVTGNGQGVGMNMSMETKMINQILYLKIVNFPMLDVIGAGELRNKWYKFDIEAIAEKYGVPDDIRAQLQANNILSKLTDEQTKQIDKLWNDEMVSFAKKIIRQKDEKINGINSYHYEIPLDKDKITELTIKTLDIMGTDIVKSEEKEALREALKATDFSKIDLWVGKEDSMPLRVAFEFAMSVPENNEKFNFKYTIFFSDFNKIAKIEAPADSTPIETLLESLGMGPESPEARTDRGAIAAMDQIRLEAELMFARDYSYVNLLCSSSAIKTECDEIDRLMGGYPLIRKPAGSRPVSYCAVIILKELSGSDRQYYCIDSRGNRVTTTTNPVISYCTKTKFTCPNSIIN